MLGAYLVITTAYSLSVKRMLLIDVLTLAGLYTMRILAGAAATGIDVSFWLLAFSIFFFLSLALVKRYVELRSIGAGRSASASPAAATAPRTRRSSRRPAWRRPFPSALVLALYIDSDAVRELYAASVDGVAAGADRPLPHHARLDPGAPRRDA